MFKCLRANFLFHVYWFCLWRYFLAFCSLCVCNTDEHKQLILYVEMYAFGVW